MDLIKQYKNLALIVLGALAFIFISFLPAVDVMGKATMSGFKYVFDADGAGFSRFLMLLCIVAPLASFAVTLVVKDKPTGRLQLIIYASAVVLALLTLGALPDGCSFAFGSWMYVLFCALGAGVGALVASDEKCA